MMTVWVSPDCLVEKHRACSGDAWDDEGDEGTACECPCHGEYVPDEDTVPVVDVPTGPYL